jgi:hypothetical protein
MDRQRFITWVTLFAFLSPLAAPALAQSPADWQMPGGCASADRIRAENYRRAAENALLQGGGAAKSMALLREMESGLSKACRAALDQEQPARVRCKANERELVLRRYGEMVRLVAMGDFDETFAMYENLEASVSRNCWIAANQHSDPRIRKNCSATELDTMATYASPGARTLKHALMTGDMLPTLQLIQEMRSKVSPRCDQALAQVQQIEVKQQRSRAPMQLRDVYDHGNGILSAPSLGVVCGPSGCMAN